MNKPASAIIDLSDISPQRTILQSYPPKPDSKSSLYITKYYTRNADGSENHIITGVHIVLKKGHKNGLWELWEDSRKNLDARNPKVKIKSLEIHCDTLEIHGVFRIPETNFTLYARKLIWGTPKACINTSPLPWSVKKAEDAVGKNKGGNGAHGRHAGTLSIFVNSIEPVDDKTPRLLARGGNGQDPGAGLDGKDGEDRESRKGFTSSVKAPALCTAKVTFDPPAIRYTYAWYYLGIKGTTGSQTWGTTKFPTNGTDALAPGIPGNAGNAGTIISNHITLVNTSDNSPGVAGKKERDYKGGSAGQPTKSAKYEVRLRLNALGTKDAKKKVEKIGKNHTTKSGKNAKAQKAEVLKGKSERKHQEQRSIWVHPLQLQRVLEYARDLHLAGALDELPVLLSDYEKTLSGTIPKTAVWNEDSSLYWARSASDIASILQRSRNHLDYYGNAAGFTPFLSLQGTVKLFEEEAERALHLLLLVNLINAKERSAKELSKILSESIKKLNAVIEQAVEQIAKGREKVRASQKQLETLRAQLSELEKDLTDLENELMDKARKDLELKAMIKGGIKMASAILKVIPVGQPALGAVGSLGDVAGDFILGDHTAADAVSEMGEVFEKVHEASEEAIAAEKKLMEFKHKFPDEKVPGSDKKVLREIGENLGPALSQASKAISAFQVPESEVEAELKRLESESEEWNEITDKIRDLNKRKSKTLFDLLTAIQEINAGYGKISSSSISINNFQKQRTETLDKLNPEAVGSVNEIEQEARHTLIYYLYLMVKAYETTILSPADVNWKLSEITSAIQKLLKTSDVEATNLETQIHDLLPLYKSNIDKIRHQLVDQFNFDERSSQLQIGLDIDQTPLVIEKLNTTGEVQLDPLSFGILLGDQQLARISNIDITTLEFDPDGPQLPVTSNAVIRLKPDNHGTLRKSEKLYAVYSYKPISWSWTYVPSAKENEKIKEDQPSSGAEDMLNFILGEKGKGIQQKVTNPPVWSDLKLTVDFAPQLPHNKKPKIKRLYLLFTCDSSPAPDHQYVLNIQKLGSPAAIKVKCTKDLGGRANGLNNFYRIFSKRSKVTLSVPKNSDGAVFQEWKLIGNEREKGSAKTIAKFSMDKHIIAQSYWDYMHQDMVEEITSPKIVQNFAKLHPEEDVREAILKEIPKAEAPVENLILHLKPEKGTSVLGMVPSLKDARVLEEGENGWKQVNYRGTIGWVHVS